jgi:dihydrofolate reductase
VRKLIYSMNVSLDGYIAARDDDISWGVPSVELHQWFNDRARELGVSLYGRRLWELMSAHWPTADQDPDATPVEVEFAHIWQETPKVVFSSTLDEVSGNARLVTGDAVAEISRLKAGEGDPMEIGGATLAGAAMRAGLIDEYQVVTHPVLVGGGTPFFSTLDTWVNLRLVETRSFPDGVTLSHYQSRR